MFLTPSFAIDQVAFLPSISVPSLNTSLSLASQPASSAVECELQVCRCLDFGQMACSSNLNDPPADVLP